VLVSRRAALSLVMDDEMGSTPMASSVAALAPEGATAL